jgi:uncharacterized protein
MRVTGLHRVESRAAPEHFIGIERGERLALPLEEPKLAPMILRATAGALALLLVVACGRGDGGLQSSDRPSFPRATVLIETDNGSKLLEVEVAETPDQQSFGLMFRESLDQDSGMVFIFFSPNQGGFWMKNTLIPLSIAFFGVDGEILKILDMEPCQEDPCPVYDPGVQYMGALEVNQGAFEKWGVKEGDVLHVRR